MEISICESKTMQHCFDIGIVNLTDRSQTIRLNGMGKEFFNRNKNKSKDYSLNHAPSRRF